jgi:hypothetical protein
LETGLLATLAIDPGEEETNVRKLIGLIAGVAMVFALTLPVAAANDKLTICHATSAENNPYVAIKVDAGAGFAPHLSDNEGNSPLAGHEQDFLLENTDLETCDQVPDAEATPLAPSVSDATCEAAGSLTLTAVEGISYTIEPAYTEGDSGDFTVTATADEGFVIADGAQTVFDVTVPAALDCPDGAEAVAPSVSGPTCAAAGTLTLAAVTGVSYTIEPAYAVGDSGEFTVTATADEGFELSGETSFTVNVPAKKVCNEGTQGGNPPASPEVPNTAMELPASSQAPLLAAIIGIVGLAILVGSNVMAVSRSRR